MCIHGRSDTRRKVGEDVCIMAEDVCIMRTYARHDRSRQTCAQKESDTNMLFAVRI